MAEGGRCPINDCGASIRRDRLMCYRHWKLVPRPLQRRVWATYRPGQENDLVLSDAYVDAMSEAIRIVNEMVAA